MGKREILLLLLLSSASFALIDPPVNDVYQHNIAAASSLNGILSQNLLNCTERLPDINDPTSFFCVKALTLTPSVNYTVTAALHPKLIWAIAESHNQTFRTNWTTDPDCSESWRQRTYGDAVLENATAYFTVNGLLDAEGGNYTYLTANDTEDLLSFDALSNVSTQLSMIDVPFKEPLISPCSIVNLVSQFILGGFFNLDCYEPALDRASPYAAGVYNLTVRNQTIVTPHLNVTVSAEIEIPYTETGQDCYKGAKGCTCDSVSDEGNATFSQSDSASYEVQNQYMTFVPYMPAFLDYSANTTEDAAFHFSVFSNSELYKYYFVMDNQTATAYYLYDFVVQNGSTGIQTIIAVPNGTIGLIPGDPGALENYTGSHLFFLNISGNVLREPYEMNNLTYNYSRVYDLMEMFFNLSSGPHHADLEFFTFFGNQTAPYNISVRARTSLMIGAGAGSANDTVDVNCFLTSRGVPVPGQEVELVVGNQTQVAVTDSTGMCPIETFQAAGRIGKAYGQFAGTPDLLPTDNYANYVLGSPFSFGTDLIGDNFALLLLLSVLFAFSAMELLGFLAMGPAAGGMTMGMVMDKFYPYKPDVGKAIAKGINSYTKQASAIAGKVVIEIASAVATAVTGGAAAPAAGAAAGGTGAAAGASGAGGAASSAAAQAAAKEAARKAAADSLKDRAMKEMSEKAGKKAAEKGIGKKIKKEMEKKAKGKLAKKKKKGVFGAAGDGGLGDDGKDDKRGRFISKAEVERNKKINPKEYHYKGVYLDPCEVEKEHAEKLHESIQKPHVADMFGQVSNTHKLLGDVGMMVQDVDKRFHDLQPELKIIGDKDFDTFVKKVYNESFPSATQGFTIDNTVYIRQSGAHDEKYLQEVIKHEDYHIYDRVEWNTGNKPKVEGFNEIMKYRDIQNDAAVSDEIKKGATIIEGQYRDFAAQQYLVKEIMGEDKFIAGHMIAGDDYLRSSFDKVAGEGSYSRIFDGSKEDRVEKLLNVHKEKFAEAHGHTVQQVTKIMTEGKYDI